MFGFDWVVIAVVVLIILVLFSGIKTIPQGSNYTVERFGRYTRTLSPGLNLIVPFIDRVGAKISMMEQVLDVPTQEVITRDNATVSADGVVFYQVLDAARAAYEVKVSLLDRGFIYAIAHVRGGEYLGRPWYEDGKLLNKKNTFTDFIDCSTFLIEKNYTSSKHLYALGGSAGGLLVGVVLNEAAELYNGVIAAVPFVDVVTTMLDSTIPLTTGEYDEWGNPNEQEFYNYIKSYSPYDNVKQQAYPHLLVTAGLHDSQVQYWEPAKWVAKIRDQRTNFNQLFLKTNMKAGHGGASGRFEALKEDAEEYSFLLALENINN